MRLRKLYWIASIALLTGTLALVGCGEDDPPTTPEPPVPAACMRDLCATNTALMNECVEEHNRCTASGSSTQDCNIFATSTCGGENIN